MDNSFRVAWETHVEPPIIPSISSDHLHDHPTNETGVTHLGIHSAHVILPSRYFLNRIRHLLKRGKNGDRNGYNYGID